ncbi:hypothetical protein [Pseudidiomarina salilacus]|uniref:hypothetical protein n=1 Tax=Pseudidiomarina salilacus TaxID=3384452 RepID=UPI003984CDC3
MQQLTSKLQVAHFIADPKFAFGAYYQFETVLPGGNHFFTIGDHLSDVNFLKMNPHRVTSRELQSSEFITYINKKFHAVVFHGLYPNHMYLCERIDPEIYISWIGMGGDYYDLLVDDVRDLLEPLTKSYFKNYPYPNDSSRIISSLKRFLKNSNFWKSRKLRLFKRINSFSPVLQTEHKAVSEKFHSTPNYIPWNYHTTNPNLVSFSAVPQLNRVWVGNSASHTNNHLDIINLFCRYERSTNRRLQFPDYVFPLSYGSKEVMRRVTAELNDGFGLRARVLNEFFGTDEYIKNIQSSGAMVMNHRRQEGGANINIALLSGLDVFMNPESLYFKELVESGLDIRTTQEIRADFLSLLEPNDMTVKRRNRDIISSMLDSEKGLRKTKNLVENIIDCI